MRYEGKLFRPPSEADAYIVQATLGCSWNHCTYCDMYRDKAFRVRDLHESLQDLEGAGQRYGDVQKLFVADGDALVMPTEHWLALLHRAFAVLNGLQRASCYATAKNLLEKTPEELRALSEAGLKLLYLGPESGDPTTLKRIAKGGTFEEHVEAAQKAHAAGMQISVITLLGAGGEDRTVEHAEGTAKLITAMDPEFLAALTLTVVPGTPIATLQERGKFVLPEIMSLLQELRTIVDQSRPTDAVFRTNHASNYLPLSGRLLHDRERILTVLDAALSGQIELRPEWFRGL